MRFIIALLAIVTLSTPASAWYKGSAAGTAGIYDNPCGGVAAGQMWCIDNNPASASYGWTQFTPTVGTSGSTCSATGTPSWDGTCVTYIASGGTGTLATCRVAATGSFDFEFDPTVGGTDMSKACPFQATYMSGARNGTPDFLLFKRGDCFAVPFAWDSCAGAFAASTNAYGICTASGRDCGFSRNGTSANAPLVIGAFGSYALNRPMFISPGGGVFGANGAFSNFVALVSIHSNGGKVFQDYRDTVYNPGVLVATTGCSGSGANCAGQTTITLPSPVSTSIINSANAVDWGVLNFSNRVQMSSGQCPAIRLTNISGTTATALANIPTNFDINVGDRLVLVPYSCGAGNISFSGAGALWNYMEDSYLEGAALVVAPSGNNAYKAFFRRNTIADSAGYLKRAQGGLFGDNFNLGAAILIEENTVHHNGWRQYDNDCTPARFMPAKCDATAQTQYENSSGSPNSQAQNIYDHEDCCYLTFRRNVSADGAGTAIQVRSGGLLENNLLGRSSGGATGGGIANPNTARYNVFFDATSSYVAIMTVRAVSGNTLTFDAVPQGMSSYLGEARGASVVAGGSGYTNGTQTLTLTGGTCSIPPQFSVTVSSNVVQAFPRPIVVTSGTCSGTPGNPAATSGGGGTGATLTVGYSSTANSAQPFNASNPTGINQTTNATFTTTATTVTIDGPAITASIGDVIYFVDGPNYGYEAAAATTNPATVSPNAANNSNVQWNIHTGEIAKEYIGKSLNLGYGIQAGAGVARTTGSVIANNYVMNMANVNSTWRGGFNDQTQIQSINGTTCSGSVGVGVVTGNLWRVGDAITISGSAPSGMNANVSTTVASISGNTLCLASAPFGTGTWTTGTGIINGGVAWGPNYVYNVAQPLSTSPSVATAGTPSAFTPVGTGPGCPQALNCPSVEAYDLANGGDGTVSHFLAQARLNRRGAWNTVWTAPAANNYIRAKTSASIALQ